MIFTFVIKILVASSKECRPLNTNVTIRDIHKRETDQQYAHFSLKIYFNYNSLYMFRTNNFSSSRRLYKQLTVFFHSFDEESSR
jgi:hypothetical protein